MAMHHSYRCRGAGIQVTVHQGGAQDEGEEEHGAGNRGFIAQSVVTKYKGGNSGDLIIFLLS